MPIHNRQDFVILEMIEQAARFAKTQPLNLGGVTGELGGVGGPPGGFIGWLPQTRVAYDETEAATLFTPASGMSLLDNLNHIRYRLNVVESGILIVDDWDGTPTITNVTELTFSGATVMDLGDGHALVIVGSGGGGSALTVRDFDDNPVITDVDDITFSGFVVTDLGGGNVLVQNVAGSGGTALTVMDADGTPTVNNVDTIIFSGVLVEDLGSGDVRVTFSGGTGSGAPLTVEDYDGSPAINNVDRIQIQGGVVTDLTAGDVLISVDSNGPQGFIHDYKITRTVASNNLTVALKHSDGTDPSSTRPLILRIDDNRRELTSALSITLNAGTNWMSCGDARFAGKTMELFVYVVWDATNSDVELGVSRVPHGKRLAEFAGSTTGELDLVGPSWTDTSDRCEVIGRFQTSMSATPNFNWSVSGSEFDIICHPIYETTWLSYQPAYSTNNGSFTWSTITTVVAVYKVTYMSCQFYVRATGTTGGTANLELRASLPFECAQAANAFPLLGSVIDGGGSIAFAFVTAGTPDLASGRRYDGANFGLGATRGINLTGLYQLDL